MEHRIQMVNNDTVLEITENQVVTSRFSEKSLLRTKANLVEAIDRFKARLSEVDDNLALIASAKRDTGKK